MQQEILPDMLRYQKLANKPKKLLCFTGLRPNQFSILAKRLHPTWEQAEKERLSRPDRKREIGAGRKYKLKTIEDKLLVVLMYYRLGTIHELLGWMAGLDNSNVSRLIRKLNPLIEKAADPELKTLLAEIKKVRKKIRSWEEFKEKYPDLAEIVSEVVTDATEHQKKRPGHKRTQKRYYSGKKKRHTLKTQISVSNTGRILNVSKTYPGSVHDKKVIDLEKTPDKIPKESRQFLDKGYDGITKDYPRHDIRIPHKRRRSKKELSRGEKQANTIRSKHRIIAENVLAKVKKYQVLSQVWRGREQNYNQTFRNVAALVNFRLAAADP